MDRPRVLEATDLALNVVIMVGLVISCYFVLAIEFPLMQSVAAQRHLVLNEYSRAGIGIGRFWWLILPAWACVAVVIRVGASTELRPLVGRTLLSATNVILFCYSVLLWGGSALDALTILR